MSIDVMFDFLVSIFDTSIVLAVLSVYSLVFSLNSLMELWVSDVSENVEIAAENLRAMRENHLRFLDTVYADPNLQDRIDEALNEVYGRSITHNWSQEGF